jgi:DNA-binding MarR family transcriptional regulator
VLTAPTSAITDLEIDSLRLMITRLARRLRKHSDQPLTPTQQSALTTLQRHGILRTGRLAEIEGIGKSTATRLTSKLEELGLVARTVDETDARSWQVVLTPVGQQLLVETSAAANLYLGRQLEGLTPDEVQKLIDAVPVLEKLLNVKA